MTIYRQDTELPKTDQGSAVMDIAEGALKALEEIADVAAEQSKSRPPRKGNLGVYNAWHQRELKRLHTVIKQAVMSIDPANKTSTP